MDDLIRRNPSPDGRTLYLSRAEGIICTYVAKHDRSWRTAMSDIRDRGKMVRPRPGAPAGGWGGDLTPEAVERLDDETLLAQINAHDPYDVEFVRRFRALASENARLRAVVADATDADFIEGAIDNVHDMDSTLRDYAEAVVRAVHFSASLRRADLSGADLREARE